MRKRQKLRLPKRLLRKRNNSNKITRLDAFAVVQMSQPGYFLRRRLTSVIHRDTMYYIKGGIVWMFS